MTSNLLTYSVCNQHTIKRVRPRTMDFVVYGKKDYRTRYSRLPLPAGHRLND